MNEVLSVLLMFLGISNTIGACTIFAEKKYIAPRLVLLVGTAIIEVAGICFIRWVMQ